MVFWIGAHFLKFIFLFFNKWNRKFGVRDKLHFEQLTKQEDDSHLLGKITFVLQWNLHLPSTEHLC